MTCETWLEIEDESSGESARKIRWRWQVRSHSGSAEVAFVSPVSEHTRALARSYVREFRSWRAKDRDWALTAERALLQLGRALGDSLVDSNYGLLELCERIEREGVGTLHVCVRSGSDLPWELLVLPDSPYTLAAACAAFVRASPDSIHPFEPRARELGLDRTRGLRVLRLDADAQVGGISLAWTQLGWQGALCYRVAARPERSEPWHIVHASIAVHGDAITVEGETLAVRDFIARVRELGAELLILEPRPGSGPADDIAFQALNAGLDNVLILSEPSELGWPSGWLDSFFELIGAGLGLGRAVVETRKRMQRALLDARQGEVEAPHAAQQWHLLRHYSQRDVVFFPQAQSRVPFESCEAFSALRASLYGFDSSALPPAAADLGDGTVLALIARMRTHGAVCVDSVHGGGLTHALHRTALFARANGDVTRAYYWNFAREAFAVHDVLEMVAGARGQTDPSAVNERSVLEPLAAQAELFVFDDVDALDAELLDAIAEFAGRIADAGGLCVLGTHTPLAVHARAERFSISPLSERESVALVQATAPHTLALGPRAFALLDRLQGHPLLIRRVFANCREDSLDSLLAEAAGDDADRTSALERFHARRWHELPRYWQALLSAWLRFDGLYLQLAMIAVDRPGGERSEVGRKLWAMLEIPDAVTFASGIQQLQAAGFVVSSGPGTRIDPAALRFLRAQPARESPSLGLQLARTLCEGVVRLLSRREHADVLTGHLMKYRALLRQEVETLARSGDYTLSARACLHLHALLVQARSNEEAADWARSYLEAAGPNFCRHGDPLVATVWLSIALRARFAPVDGILELGANHWAERLRAMAVDPNPAWRNASALAIGFLEKVHDSVGDYAAYRDVARFACERYRTSENWVALIPQLQALAAAEHTLGDATERDRIERELVDGIAYADLPGGTELRRQTLTQLCGVRLRRSDERGAEAVLEHLEREWQGDAPNTLALWLRSELAVLRREWERAAELACRVWSAALTRKQQDVDVDAVARRLLQLEQRLGPERFTAVYAEHAAETPTPAELGAV